MAKDETFSVKEAVHKLQLFLLDGIRHENQLFAAGSLMSQSDYEDVVTERSISELCGYPLCNNHLPSERPGKGRYRISLKEHKVYDLQETYMYCSSGCLINSRAFAGSLQPERCLVSNPLKINEVLNLFGDSSIDESVFGKKGDLGLSDLKIQEIEDTKTVGELSMENWVGPSNAIEGYVPKDRSHFKFSRLKQHDEGSKTGRPKPKKGTEANEMDFTSVVTIGDPFNNPKTSCSPLIDGSESLFKLSREGEVSSKVMGYESSPPKATPAPFRKWNGSLPQLKEPKEEVSGTTLAIMSRNPSSSFGPSQSAYSTSPRESKREVGVGETTQSIENTLKSSLKCSGAKKSVRNVSWADERKISNEDNGKISNEDNGNICSGRQMGEVTEHAESSSGLSVEDDDSSVWLASAEACAAALSQAAEAVASCESDVSSAVMEAGIRILPHTQDADEENSESVYEPELMRWAQKPGFAHFELHGKMYCESWYDTVPEGFSLGLSSFATMFMALFGWITSSSLAYIYGRDESSCEEFSVVNGREYPCKKVLSDGRSSEIKQTLAGCLAQALPGLVMDLRLPTPVSSLEQGLGHLLDTMSFLVALPPFRTKQWNVIILVFIDALSVSRFPALTPYMTSRRMLLHKVLDGAAVSVQEYETMKDIVLPLGRLPQFSTQSGA
ncbi:putative RNA polymerase II subunit B1 CTD phosphatase RPAP2 homolog [Telopea speciosissima]|uniref:putative RNA polymerase II subunit B1 CTD phosphatase RPAP2 homolog n=1 Tax=Telopea speciosissima TaxID=54955 RepID=UPI001CC43284|nr:putative RNA polymerase II subunit B1 CTD phosphatase RPAP2 homolog [Telopea speciosissima]